MLFDIIHIMKNFVLRYEAHSILKPVCQNIHVDKMKGNTTQ
jgi:hypothetical protein